MSYPADQKSIEMEKFPIKGNIIDHTWSSFILTDTKIPRPDPIAMMLLAEIVYWYRPSLEIIDGKKVLRKKYKEDLLQKSYQDLENDLGFTHKQLKGAFLTLERIGVVKRILRTVYSNGSKVGNVLYIELYHTKLQSLREKELNKSIPSVQIETPLRTNWDGASVQIGTDKYIESLTEKTQKEKKEKKERDAPSSLCTDLLSEFHESLTEALPEIKASPPKPSEATHVQALLNKHSPEEIRNTFKFAHKDPFWSTHVHSVSYLKRKFATLLAASKNANSGYSKSRASLNGKRLTEYDNL